MQIELAEKTPKETIARALFAASDGGPPVDLPFSLDPAHTRTGAVSVWYIEGKPTLLMGLGSRERMTADDIRRHCGAIAREARKEGWPSLTLELPGILAPDVETRVAAEGLLLGNYAFDKYKRERTAHSLETVVLGERFGSREALAKGMALAKGAILARDLANEPSNILRPETFAGVVEKRFKDTPVRVKTLDDEGLRNRQMVGLLAVGKGSAHTPRFIEAWYQSDPTKPLTVLVGKGITFDTGGISLKSGRSLSDMRMDMSGAAAVIGAIEALYLMGAACNVVGLVAAAENIPGGAAMLPGELIAYPNGVSVEVANTDAEGRLVLADALIRAAELEPACVVDIATLTGAAAAALGPKYGALFATDDLAQELLDAGNETGDFLWRMPLPDEYEEQLDSAFADVCNIGSGEGGAITAALFLRKFVKPGLAWGHIDMAGPMETDKARGYFAKGATGFGARVLTEFVLRFAGRS